MSEEIVLYTNPMSRGQIARWMLEEVGAEYRTEILQYGPEMKSQDFLAVNPMGKVPTIRHGGVVVTEGRRDLRLPGRRVSRSRAGASPTGAWDLLPVVVFRRGAA